MVSCAVAYCKNASGKNTKDKHGITFHRFPSDKTRRQKWECAVARGAWSATPSSAVCSEHFETKDFYLTEGGLRRLSIDAIPLINISPCQEAEPTISQLVYKNDSSEVVALKQKVTRLEVLAKERKRRVNLMWQSKLRMKQKIEELKKIIRQLIRIKKEGSDKNLHDKLKIDFENI